MQRLFFPSVLKHEVATARFRCPAPACLLTPPNSRIPIRPSSCSSFFLVSSKPRLSSTSTPTSIMSNKKEYLVMIPDHPNSLQKRIAVRPKHLEKLKPHLESGDVVFGGATLSAHPKDGEQPDMT